MLQYCRHQNLDESTYLNFIQALRLPPGHLHLRTVIETLQIEYERASRFSWLSEDDKFIAEKIIISNIAHALEGTARHSSNFHGSTQTYQLTALLIKPHPEHSGLISEVYAVLKIYAIRYSLQLLEQDEEEAKTLSYIVEKIRQRLSKTKSKNYVVDGIYAGSVKFTELLKNKISDWSIQSQFVDWIEKDLVARPQISRNINATNSEALTSEHAWARKLAVQTFKLDKNSAIPGETSSYLALKPEKTLDEDESFEEIFEFTADPEHPVSMETAEQTLLYGNRLRTQERLLLALRSNVLTSYELNLFIKGCVHDLEFGDEVDALCSATLMLILLTARDLDDIYSIKVNPVLPSQVEGVDCHRGFWRRKSIQMPNAVRPDDLNQPFLFKHTDYVDLSLPAVLVVFLQKLVSEETTWGHILRRKEISEEQLLSRLKMYLKGIPRRNTLAQIRQSLFQQLANKTDPGYAAFVLATSEPITPTPLYYKSASVGQLQKDYASCLSRLKLDVRFQPNEDDYLTYTGSRLAVDDRQLATFFQNAYENLNQLFDIGSQTEQGVIHFLNELTCYTTVVLLSCTGHRNRLAFQFEPALFNFELDMMILSDKAQYEDSAMRFVPFVHVAKGALANYAKTCRALSGKLSNYKLKNSLLTKSLWLQSEIGSPFLSMITDGVVSPISNEDVRQYLERAGLKLPMNFFRHRLCSKLSEVLSGDVVNWIMGHVGEGEHPFSLTSMLTLTYISECRHSIEQAIEPLNIPLWEAPSLRGSPALPHFKPTSVYIPDYLTVKRMSARQRVQWVKNIFLQFSQTIEPDRTLLDCLDEFMDCALDKALNLKNYADSVSCIKIINRKIERLAINAEVPQTQHWRMPLSESLLELDSQFFYQGRRIRHLRSQLATRIMHSGYSIDPQHAVNEIVLSVVVQSSIHFTTTQFVTALQSDRVTVGGLHFFDYLENAKMFRVFIDPITLGLIKRYPHFSKQTFSEKRFLKFAQSLIECEGVEFPASAFSSLSELSHHIAFYDNHLFEPSLMRSFRLNKIDSSPLSQDALMRLLTPGVLVVKRSLCQPQHSAHYKSRGTHHSVQLKDERRFFESFIKTIRSKLLAPASGLNIKMVVPQIWAEFVKSSSVAIRDLLAKSGHLSDAAIAVLLFMTDVGKRRGRGRKSISLNTLKTYYSKICVPLLDVAQDQKIFELDEDELANFYTNVLDCRELETRSRHAQMLSDLHRCVEEYLYLPDIDWFDIEPNMYNEDEKKVANILTTSDYQQVLDLLMNDPYSDERVRLAQSAIVILAYRCGMRRSEIKYRLHQDVETEDGLFYVYSNKYYRLKTINANRRIPANLLLNDDERQIIARLVESSKRLDPSPQGRLFNFSDNEYAQMCGRVIEAIVAVTKNEEARLHDCRHSFATFICWVGIVIENSILNSYLSTWCRMSPALFLKKWLAVTTGQTVAQSHKFLDTLSMVMGHGTPLTTISHYVHELSLLNLEYQSQYFETNRLITNKNLGQWLEISETNTRQISSRSELSPHISLMQQIMKSSWQLPKVLVMKERGLPMLSEKSSDSRHLENWLDNLAQFRRLAFTTEELKDDVSPLMGRLYELFENRQHSTPFDLVTPTGQIKANKHIHSRVKHALSGTRTAFTLTNLSVHNVIHAKLTRAIAIVLDGYAGNHGLFIPDERFSGLEGLEEAGVTFVFRRNGTRNIGKLSKKGAFYGCQLKKNDITDEIYVISTLLSV